MASNSFGGGSGGGGGAGRGAPVTTTTPKNNHNFSGGGSSTPKISAPAIEEVVQAAQTKQVLSNAAKGIYLTGLEKMKNPENRVKMLNANVNGQVNNRNNPYVYPIYNKDPNYDGLDKNNIVKQVDRNALVDIKNGKYGDIAFNGNIPFDRKTGHNIGIFNGIVFDAKTQEVLNPKSESKAIVKKETTFEDATKQNPLVTQMIEGAKKLNTVVVLTDESGKKVTGVEYGGMSYTPKGFENTFGSKVLYDPDKQEFFFGTSSVPESKAMATISAGYTPITKKEFNQVKKQLAMARIKEGNFLDAATNTNYQKNFENFVYDNVARVTAGIDAIAQKAKDQATQVLQESDFKTGNKAIDLSAKGLGYVSYVTGSAAAYSLHMVSGLGNIANSFEKNPLETSKELILAAPAMIKGSAYEIARTYRREGTIEDFFGAALTLSSVASAAAGFSKYGASLKNIKLAGQLKKDLPAIKLAVKQSQGLLKKQQLYLQGVVVENANKWKTFGSAIQAMKGMTARHEWYSLSQGSKSGIVQKSIISDGKVTMVNFMVAKSMSSKILSILRKTVGKGKAELVVDRFQNSGKIASYLSKTQAARQYTFIKVAGNKVITAIDGRGNIRLLKNGAEVKAFMAKAEFGKFSFTGKRAVGGGIQTIFQKTKQLAIGSEGFNQLAYRKNAGITMVTKAEQAASKSINYFRGKTGSKAFRTIKENVNNYAWRKSTQESVNKLMAWGKDDPAAVRSLLKDLKKVYNPKDISYSQWRAATQRAGKKFDSFARRNPDKIRSLIDDSKKIYGNGMQQLTQESKIIQPQLSKKVFLSKQVSNSVTGSQLKSVSKAIEKVISKNDLALKNGVRAVVAPSGLMFFNKYGQLISAKEATNTSAKDIAVTRSKIVDIVSDYVGQNPRSSPSYKSSQNERFATNQISRQRSKQMSRQMQQSSSAQRSNYNYNFNQNVKPKVAMPSLDYKRRMLMTKKILGSKLAPSYRIVIGSGKKVKTLSGRYSAQEAISKGAYTIDRTKERTVRIVPTKQRPNAKFKINYLKQAGQKFRNYRIRAGKKVRFSSTRLIEKRKYFNDLEKLNKYKRKRR